MTSLSYSPACRSGVQQGPIKRIATAAGYFAAVALMALAATSQIASAQLASGTTGIDATGDARSEMAACLNGTTQQAKETCMTEVRNANAAKRAGKIDNSGGQFSANAMKRCDVFSGEDLIACQARIAGYGQTQGGVAGGGVIRQVETVVVPADAGSVRVQPQTSSGPIVIIPPAR